MGHVDTAPQPAAIEVPLPWGPVVRGVRWGSGLDAIVLLHEPEADLDGWAALPARLAKLLGVTAIAIDLPGHGLSDDPWEPEKIGELIRFLVAPIAATPGSSLANLEIFPAALAERGIASGRGGDGCRFVIAAGSVAAAALPLAADLSLAGIVVLSPSALGAIEPSLSSATPPALRTTEAGARGAKKAVPKLLFAGSLAADDLENARRLASGSAGWTAVTSVPIAARGTNLLASPWGVRIEEEITAFFRDCQHRGTGRRPGPRIAPSVPG